MTDRNDQTSAQPTAFDQAREILSGLYRHFLMFDLTYVVGGMVMLLVIMYAACLVNGGTGDLYNLTNDFIDKTIDRVGKNNLASVAFIALSYFTGLICYDLADNIFYRLYRFLPYEVLEWQGFDVMIRRKIKDTDEANVLITKFDRTHHFEIVNMTFVSVFTISTLIMAAIGPFLYFCYALLLTVLTVVNCYGVALYKGEFTAFVYHDCCQQQMESSGMMQEIRRRQTLLAQWAGGGILIAALLLGLYLNGLVIIK